MKRILFLDRDGTILKETEDELVDHLNKFEFLPGVISNLSRIVKEFDFELVMITNQDGLGTAVFPEEKFWPLQNLMLSVLGSEGIVFSDIQIDRTYPQENAPTRKPGTALLSRYLNGGYNLSGSFVIGDRLTDVQLAQNLGAKSILIGEFKNSPATYTVSDWFEIYSILARS